MDRGVTQSNWYVITGGPSTGKTTLIKELKKLGYTVVPEAARTVIDEALAKGISVEELRSDEKKFQETVAYLKRDIEKKLDPSNITFFDRGMQDSEAYLGYYGFDMNAEITELMNHSRYKKVFLLDPLEKYKKDYARVENEDFRKHINDLLESAYTNHNMKPVRLADIGLANRVNLVQSHIKGE